MWGWVAARPCSKAFGESDDAFAHDGTWDRFDHRDAQLQKISVSAILVLGHVMQEHAELFELTCRFQGPCVDGSEPASSISLRTT